MLTNYVMIRIKMIGQFMVTNYVMISFKMNWPLLLLNYDVHFPLKFPPLLGIFTTALMRNTPAKLSVIA